MNILITGGASGLGKAITLKLASSPNNKVYITYSNSVDAASTIQEEYPNCIPVFCNFRKPESIQEVVDKMGTWDIDVLVNNAFTGMIKKHSHKIPLDNFEDSFKVNVLPVIALTQAAIKGFRKKKFGKIITILSSVIIANPPIGWALYAAEKEYLRALSKSWAIELKKYNITSNSISPTFMLTALNQNTDERILNQMIDAHPLKKLLTPEEVADSVHFLVESTQQINGINLVINAAENVI